MIVLQKKLLIDVGAFKSPKLHVGNTNCAMKGKNCKEARFKITLNGTLKGNTLIG